MRIYCFALLDGGIAIEKTTPDPAGGRADRDRLANFTQEGAERFLAEVTQAVSEGKRNQEKARNGARLDLEARIRTAEEHLKKMRSDLESMS